MEIVNSQIQSNNHQSGCHNAGFSLVELIIVVSILAIAAVPLMKSMGMSSKINAKAQSLQNATSLGEKIMEEMKGTPVANIKTKYGKDFDASGKMVIPLTGQTATQGETFDVTVTIDKAEYSGSAVFDRSGSSTAKKENVRSANTLMMPRIEEIDTQSQAVLTKKELNKYDTEALNYFNQKLAGYNPSATPPVIAHIKTKTIDIEKKNITLPNDGVTVKATVTYTDESGNPYVRDLYTGTFVQQEDKDGNKKHFDSNIYIFYTVGMVDDNHDGVPEKEIRETINIKDSSDVTAFEEYDESKPMDCHKVYFIRQVSSDLTGPEKITFSGTTDVFKFSDSDKLVSGRKEYGDIELFANLTSTLSEEGHVYKEEARNSVYSITVELKKNGNHITTLNSTVTADDPL